MPLLHFWDFVACYKVNFTFTLRVYLSLCRFSWNSAFSCCVRNRISWKYDKDFSGADVKSQAEDQTERQTDGHALHITRANFLLRKERQRNRLFFHTVHLYVRVDGTVQNCKCPIISVCKTLTGLSNGSKLLSVRYELNLLYKTQIISGFISSLSPWRPGFEI